MSIKLSELKRKEIRKTINTGDKDYPIEIYNPTKEQKLKILELMKENINVDENGITSKIEDRDFVVKLLGDLTNIYIDVEDNELVDSILNDPSDILVRVNIELTKISDEIFNMWFEGFKSINSLPEEVQNAMYKKMVENEDDSEKQRKIEELKKQLEELEGQ